MEQAVVNNCSLLLFCPIVPRMPLLHTTIPTLIVVCTRAYRTQRLCSQRAFGDFRVITGSEPTNIVFMVPSSYSSIECAFYVSCIISHGTHATRANVHFEDMVAEHAMLVVCCMLVYTNRLDPESDEATFFKEFILMHVELPAFFNELLSDASDSEELDTLSRVGCDMLRKCMHLDGVFKIYKTGGAMSDAFCSELSSANTPGCPMTPDQLVLLLSSVAVRMAVSIDDSMKDDVVRQMKGILNNASRSFAGNDVAFADITCTQCKRPINVRTIESVVCNSGKCADCFIDYTLTMYNVQSAQLIRVGQSATEKDKKIQLLETENARIRDELKMASDANNGIQGLIAETIRSYSAKSDSKKISRKMKQLQQTTSHVACPSSPRCSTPHSHSASTGACECANLEKKLVKMHVDAQHEIADACKGAYAIGYKAAVEEVQMHAALLASSLHSYA